MSSTTAFRNSVHYWSISKKITFRFIFILFTLFIFLNNNGAFPFFDVLMGFPTQLLHQFIPWVAENVLKYKYDHTIFTNGSGDTSYDYVLLATMGITSVVGAMIWSLLDWKRKSYNTLYYWLLVLVRFYLALTLFNYGMYKIIKLQFPYPSLSRLMQPYGDSSPMGLAWTFLGYSKGYNLFMGIIEVSAILVLFRRTMVMGAFLALAASAHVMSMNYFYDVPVKILSTALVVMCLFIIAPYLKKILSFFLLDKTVSLQTVEAPSYKKRWQYYSLYAFKYLLIVYVGISTVNQLMYSSRQYGEAAPKAPLYGIYKTERFTVNHVDLPPLTTDSVRWAQLILQWDGYANIKLMNESASNASFKVDTVKKQIKFHYNSDTLNKSILSYTVNKDLLNIKGLIKKDSVDILLRKVDLKKFRLINQDFRWVNEFPPNR